MKMMHYRFSSIVAFVVTLMTATLAFSQVPDSLPTQRRKNNFVGVTFSVHEFFDGSPIIQSPTPGTLAWMNVFLGLEYSRRLGQKNGFEASVALGGPAYWYGPYPRYPGDMFTRTVLFSELAYQRYLLESRRTTLAGIVGGNFRMGDEAVAANLGALSVLLEDYSLLDLGISVGARGTKLLFWNVVLSAELKFTQYVYLWEKHNNTYFPFHNRPTSNMLTMQMGLGYRF
jgi:hypothetical protein